MATAKHGRHYSKLLSEKECLEIVSKACGDARLITYEIVPASEDIVGYLGDYYKLIVAYSNENRERHKINFFIKSLPLRNELHKEEIVSKGFMEKERLAYSTLFKDMAEYSPYKWHANAYLVREDLIVLEDLLWSEYNIEKYNFDFPPAQLLIVLECLAGMHANSLVFEEKAKKNIEKDYEDVAKDISLNGNPWYTTGLKAICKVASIHPKYQTEAHQLYIEKELPEKLNIIYEISQPSREFKNTLSHRDLWEKNILFKTTDDGLESIFVDFQVACYIPPAVDVLFFLYLNTTKATREAFMTNYLDHYYNCLWRFCSQQDVKINKYLSRLHFYESCLKFENIALILAGVYAPISYLPDGYLGGINQRNPEDFKKIMNEDRDEFILDCIQKYEEYGKRVLGTVRELMEHICPIK